MSFSFVRINIFISFNANCICSFLDFIILIATVSLFLWSKARTTYPKAPLPKHYKS